jgi:hypothetical protein
LKLGWAGLLEAAETVGNGLKLGWTELNCWRRQKQWANRRRDQNREERGGEISKQRDQNREERGREISKQRKKE